jgi:hypothetical protein
VPKPRTKQPRMDLSDVLGPDVLGPIETAKTISVPRRR